MGRDHWKQIDNLFRQMLDMPPGRAREFLEALETEDEDLRHSVVALLRAVEDSGAFLQKSVEQVCAPPWEKVFDFPEELGAPRERSGERIGPYRLVRRIGSGGMATVYLAERADGLWEQEVALKLIRRGLDSDEVVRRFLAERQILSSLRHSNIASLFDGGTTAEGLPYLVMEYVQGTPITGYCDERRLSVDARLQIFCEVGRAVQHAHRSLIVHRDLKPSNILVTDQRQVKLLDFGIAKLLDAESDPRANELTRPGHLPLTPEYASPEQLAGRPVTTSSDVYQLGLLLYDLLCGHRPQRIEQAWTPIDMHRTTGAVPEPPSKMVRREPVKTSASGDATTLASLRSTTPDRLSRRLRGDLDKIVEQALRPVPDERYDSVAALVEDVERHAEKLPIRARAPTRRYRLRKFLHRNRWVAPVTTVAVLAAGLYAFTVDRQTRALERERNVARTEVAKAEEVKGFLIGLFDAADPAVTDGRSVSARELVDEGTRRVGQELANQPEVQAEMLSALADVYWRLALAERALSLAREALDVRLSHFGEGSPEISASLRQVARMTSFPGYATSASDDADPEDLFRRSIEATRAAHGPQHPLYAQALHDWAMYGDHSPERQVALQDSAIAILRAAPEERVRLSEVLAEAARGDESARRMRLAEEALALRLELFGEEHGGVAASLSDLALMMERSDPDSSIQLLHRALEIQRVTAGPRHPRTLSIQNNLAGVLRDRGEYAEAVPMYREVLTLRQAEGQNLVPQAYTKYGLAVSLVGLGRHEEAEPLLRDVLEAFPPTDVRHNMARLTLSRALEGQGRLEEAEAVLLSTLAAIEAGAAGPAEDVRDALAGLRGTCPL